MSDVTEFLAEQKRLAEAATEGPWKLDVARYDTDFGKVVDYGINGVAALSEFEDSSPWHMACYPLDQEDAEFIAAARSSVPRMIAALGSVLKLHQREVIAVHPGYGEEAACVTCEEHWPCPTIRAVEAKLLGSEGE